MGVKALAPSEDSYKQRAENRAVSDAGDIPSASPDATEYVVTGRHSIAGVKPGETLRLLPDSEQTKCLIEAGHVRPVEKKAPPVKKGPTNG